MVAFRRIGRLGLVGLVQASVLVGRGGEAEASRLLASCGDDAALTAYRDDAVTTIVGVNLAVMGARAGTSTLGGRRSGKTWLVVTVLVDTRGTLSIGVDSDDFVVVVDDEHIKETADDSDEVTKRLGHDEMGNILGSTVPANTTKTYPLIYAVPTDGKVYALEVTNGGDFDILDLLPAIDACMETSALVMTSLPSTEGPCASTSETSATVALTATPGATGSARMIATRTPNQTSTQMLTATRTPTPTPPASLTRLG